MGSHVCTFLKAAWLFPQSGRATECHPLKATWFHISFNSSLWIYNIHMHKIYDNSSFVEHDIHDGLQFSLSVFLFWQTRFAFVGPIFSKLCRKKSIFAVLAARLEPSRSRVRYGDHDYDPNSWDGDHWRDVSFLFILWCLGLLKPHIWCMVRDTWAVIHCWQFWFSCKHGCNSLYSYPLYNFIIIAWSIFMPLRFLDTLWVWHMVSRIF